MNLQACILKFLVLHNFFLYFSFWLIFRPLGLYVGVCVVYTWENPVFPYGLQYGANRSWKMDLRGGEFYLRLRPPSPATEGVKLFSFSMLRLRTLKNMAPSHICSPFSLAELGPKFNTPQFIQFSLVSSSFLGRSSLIVCGDALG